MAHCGQNPAGTLDPHFLGNRASGENQNGNDKLLHCGLEQVD
jgi:hypothetical protein